MLQLQLIFSVLFWNDRNPAEHGAARGGISVGQNGIARVVMSWGGEGDNKNKNDDNMLMADKSRAGAQMRSEYLRDEVGTVCVETD